MAEIIHPQERIEPIAVDALLTKVMEKKKAGMRLSQACAAYIDEQFELSYSFADDETYQYDTLRVVIAPEVEVPSVTEIIPQAVFYENEMKELFGVKIRMISVDYNNKLYRIKAKQPLGPEVVEEPETEAVTGNDAPQKNDAPGGETASAPQADGVTGGEVQE